MSTVLNIINNFSVLAKGNTFTGKQGAEAAAFSDPVQVTVLGDLNIMPFTLPTGSAFTLWEAATDDPVTFAYMHFWADTDCWLQILTAAGEAVFLIKALVPFVLPGSTALLNAGTAALDGTVSPTLVPITKVVCVNRSGGALKGQSNVIN